MNLKTGTALTAPDFQKHLTYIGTLSSYTADGSPFFTQDSTALVGISLLPNGGTQAVRFSNADGTVTNLCSGAASLQAEIKEIDSNRFVILNFSPDSEVLDVYLSGPDKGCLKVNSAVLNSQAGMTLTGFVISPDKSKILAELASFDSTSTKSNDHLVFVPLDGKPSYIVNTPVSDQAYITDAGFADDSKSIVYVGNQIRLNERDIFLWRAPSAP
jgi:hypothetical protein